ncbi:unnamed protein product [Pleuronectes platessa]|uniref:Uncharacterized protein n=1 Tax=Pleuronectes platessa TaxID=8262 RepID=A0A9N7Z1D8_PLEPL|nr:unnamed protein product [Pleuronectes platessa]
MDFWGDPCSAWVFNAGRGTFQLDKGIMSGRMPVLSSPNALHKAAATPELEKHRLPLWSVLLCSPPPSVPFFTLGREFADVCSFLKDVLERDRRTTRQGVRLFQSSSIKDGMAQTWPKMLTLLC